MNTEISAKGTNSIDQIFHDNNWDQQIGLISIDIDSFDYHVWKNLQFVNPQIVVIEFNNLIPSYIDYHDTEDEVFLRCSAKSLEKLGEEKGYKLICCTVTNCIFIKNDLFDESKFPDAPVECLFDYKGQMKNGSIGRPIVKSQMVSCFPVFAYPPSRLDRLFFRAKAYLMAIFTNNEKYRKPSKQTKKNLKEANLYV